MGLLDEDDKSANEIANAVVESFGIELNPQPDPEPQIAPGYNVIAENLEAVEEPTEFDLELSEVERRLAKAQLYKQFLVNPIFDGSGPIVAEVSKEFQDFAKQQLQILMGVISKPTESSFTTEQIVALQTLANKILQNPKVLEGKPAKQPKLAPVVVTPPKPVTKPTLKVTKVPVEVPQRTAQQKPAPKPYVRPSRPIPLNNKLTIPEDNSVITENDGKTYKIRYAKMTNVDEFGIMDGSKARTLQEGGTCVLSNQIQVLRKNGEYIKILKELQIDKTQVPGRLPMPSNEQMAGITLTNATIAATKINNNPLTSMALNAPPKLDNILGE